MMMRPYDGMRPVETIHNGWIVLVSSLGVVARGLRSNAQAWEWIDRNTDEGRADRAAPLRCTWVTRSAHWRCPFHSANPPLPLRPKYHFAEPSSCKSRSP
jgi:hypothetical protein